jgi:tetratricopeptide (TPR) repeat protein
MRLLVVLFLLGSSVGAACTTGPSRDAATGAPDAQLDAALAACADDTKDDSEACRTAIRSGLLESGGRLPENEGFYRRLAKAFLAEGQVPEAVAIYRIAVSRYPLNADFHYQLGYLLVDRLAASEEALGPFMLAVKHRPQFPEARLALARVQYNIGFFDEALEQYRALVDLDSSSAEAMAGWGQSLAAKGDHKAAIEILERATRLPSAYEDVWWTALARSQAALGRSDVAVGSLRRSVALNPESRDAFCLLAQLLTTAGKAEEARAACTQALRPTQHRGSECACTP